MVPDLALVGWLPFALPRALGLAHRERFDCVITTSPPQTAHLIGAALRATGVPWIADLRDGWTYDPPRGAWPTALQTALDRALEEGALRRADRLVAVTAPIADDLACRLSREVAVITNGFDPEESSESGVDGLLTPGRHSLVHTGRAGVAGRSPRTFLEGIVEFRRRWPDLAERLEIVFAGPTTTEERALLADERLGGMARTVGMLDRPQAVALQRGADSLLVFAQGASAPSVATNKLFEYLAARQPFSSSATTARRRGSSARPTAASAPRPATRRRSPRRSASWSPAHPSERCRPRTLRVARAGRAIRTGDRRRLRAGLRRPERPGRRGVNVIVVGPAEPAGAVATALARRGAQVRIVRAGAGRGALASALVRALRLKRRRAPDAVVTCPAPRRPS